MQIVVFSLFPEIIEQYSNLSILGRAQSSGALELKCVNIRDFGTGKRHCVDDMPFGGGAGMVMTPAPIFDAVEATNPPSPIFLLAPWGRKFDQTLATELATLPGFTLICGRYEGVDARVEESLIDGAISLGDFVLAGGEIAALAVLEATTRLLHGVLGNPLSTHDESFVGDQLEYPQYTRPANYRNMLVPEVLLNGNHKEISAWRELKSRERTIKHRPDLVQEAPSRDD